MKINLDDPKLTAYALGELDEPERSAVAEAIAGSAEAQAFVKETQQLARMLRGEFGHELQQASAKPRNIMPLPEERATWPETRWSSLALAAVVGVGAIVAAVVIVGSGGERRVRSADRAERAPLLMEFDLAAESAVAAVSGEPVDGEGGFVSTGAQRVSEFPLRVGTGSYRDVRRYLASGVRPPSEAVRIEELINRFTYEYSEPTDDQGFSISIDAAGCPWTPDHRLVRIRVKARDAAPAAIIAREANIQVTFDPARVTAYRLIGYEAGGRAASGASGATDVPAGQRTTALYEIVPTPAEGGADVSAAPLVAAKLTYRRAEADTLASVDSSFVGRPQAFADAPPDFRFAAAVAQFGLLLRESTQGANVNFAPVADWARSAAAAAHSAERSEFIALVEQAQAQAL